MNMVHIYINIQIFDYVYFCHKATYKRQKIKILHSFKGNLIEWFIWGIQSVLT